jgi:hypothetical protein
MRVDMNYYSVAMLNAEEMLFGGLSGDLWYDEAIADRKSVIELNFILKYSNCINSSH